MMISSGSKFGPYTIKNVFDSGGMGTVYQAHHERWSIDVALKVVKERFAKCDSFEIRFMREAEIWSTVGLHPNVATCYYTQMLDGRLCLCAEFVEGGSLQDWIKSRALYGSEDEAVVSTLVQIAAGIALGLDWAHQHRLIHQDVKPENVLLTGDTTPKITDFGLARAMSADGNATASGLTPPYASPEQIQGRMLSQSTDIWSWAVTVLSMFMGGIQWESALVVPSVFTDYCSQHRRIPGLPQMPQAVADILERCLKMNPAERPSSCCALASELDAIHYDLFGENIDFSYSGSVELATDSLNNRAVSLVEMDRWLEAEELLDQLVQIRPDHFEGNFNRWLLLAAKGDIGWKDFRTKFARLKDQHSDDAPLLLQKAKSVLDKPFWRTNPKILIDQLPFVLARPRSGGQHHHEASRFNRLLAKSESAFQAGNCHDAKRYLRMAMDIDGFSTHPRLSNMAARMSM